VRPLRLLLALPAAFWFAGCSRESASAPSLPSLPVHVASVERETHPAVFEIPGTIRPADRAVVAAKITGTVDSLPLVLGQSVRQGDLLARLAAPELIARLAQSRAQLDQAEREEKRDRELSTTGAGTTDAARAAAERLRTAKAALAEAQALLAYTEIRAPYDGRVAQKLAYTGDLATPGQPLVVLESAAALQVEAAVPASLAAHLRTGTRLNVALADGAAGLCCAVTEIASAADPATHTVLIRLALASRDPALSGRAVRVALAGPAAESLTVPASAVTRFGQIERVWIVADRRAQLRLVKTGATLGAHIELLAGVSEGEVVIVDPPLALRDGQPVTSAP